MYPTHELSTQPGEAESKIQIAAGVANWVELFDYGWILDRSYSILVRISSFSVGNRL
jgi:hypothetical protein